MSSPNDFSIPALLEDTEEELLGNSWAGTSLIRTESEIPEVAG